MVKIVIHWLNKLIESVKQRRHTMAEQHEVWSAELVLTVRGPKEGPVTVKVNYDSTTRAQCERLQNALAQLGQQLNAGK